ncbi:MAG: hypothetical protein AB8G11_04155 [Saprospiraceae bacterium]
MKRQLLIVGILLMTWTAFSQSVEKVVFERGVDYINCQITRISLEDQIGQAHVPAYKKQIGNHNCDFENLVVFLKTRSTGVMTKNLELSFFINSYKEKYDATLTNSELYSILKDDLFKESAIQNFKIRHETSFPNFESIVNDYLINLFSLKETVTETIDEEWGDIVMVEDDEETSPTTNPTTNPTTTIPTTPKEERPSIVEPRPERKFTPFDFEEDESIFSYSSWLFRFSLLFASLAVLLYVLLPYYEKREKAKVKKPGNEVHPKAMALEVEVAILENKNRMLRQKIDKMHLDLNDYEDTFRSL